MQQAASVNGSYPLVRGATLLRANWLVLAEAHERDKALLAEQQLTVLCGRLPSLTWASGSFPGNPWEGQAAIPNESPTWWAIARTRGQGRREVGKFGSQPS